MNLLQIETPCLAHVEVLLDDIGAWKPFFRNISFSFISSVCNQAAQALVIEAVFSLLDHVWFGGVSSMHSSICVIRSSNKITIVSIKKYDRKLNLASDIILFVLFCFFFFFKIL